MNIEKVYTFNSTIEIERGYSANYGKKMAGKNKKWRPTPEKMEEHNKRQAVRKLRRLIKANFCSDDWHMTLTYSKNDRPSADQANKVFTKFMRKMRDYCKKLGIVLKYITVTEYENAAIHHHMIINNFKELFEFVRKNWLHGANYTQIHNDDDVATLAEYFIKETDKTFRNKVGRKLRYTRSRNLVVPKPEIHVRKNRSFGNIEVPKKYKGEYILDVDSVVETVDDFGHIHQSFTLKRINGEDWRPRSSGLQRE